MIYRFCLGETTEAKASGEYLIHTIDEILDIALNTSASNILKFDRDAVAQNFTTTSFNTLIGNIKAINPNLGIETDYKLEVVADDVIRRLNCARDVRDVMFALSAHPKEGLETIKTLTGKILNYSKEAQEISAKLAEVGHTVANLENENDSLQNDLTKVRKSRDYYAALTEIMRNRFEGKFLKPLEESSLNYCNINSFDSIVVFKEISPVKDFDNMLKALLGIAEKVYDMPSRLLVIAPYGNSMLRYRYPALKWFLDLTTEDVLVGNILCAGFQHKIITDILRNGSKISTLYVYDATGSDIQHIIGNNVQTYYICDDINIMEALQINPNLCIGAGYLKIEEIQDREKLSNSEILGYYSRQNIIQTILSNERR